MEYRILIDKKKLSNILFSVSSYCKGKLRFYEDTSHTYINSDRTNTSFCRILSRKPASNALCTKCNENANRACKKRVSAYAYYCHANLLEIALPVFYDKTYVGNINIGQFRTKTKTIDDTYLADLAKLSGVSTEKLRKAYNSQPNITDDGIAGGIMILEMTAKKLCEENVFSVDLKNTIVQTEQYIRANLSGDLSLDKIASEVYVNPSYLSAMYHKATGETISHFIQKERIAHAVYLFSISTMSIGEISLASGFKDPNYFTKVFRRETGYSPREYRQKLARGDIIY